jgi:hypothetical protein
MLNFICEMPENETLKPMVTTIDEGALVVLAAQYK